jgi:trehalose-6-phosphate synthase/trehalose-6-phosphatase
VASPPPTGTGRSATQSGVGYRTPGSAVAHGSRLGSDRDFGTKPSPTASVSSVSSNPASTAPSHAAGDGGGGGGGNGSGGSSSTREALTDSDGILLVQYQLPVRLYKVYDTPSTRGTIPAAASQPNLAASQSQTHIAGGSDDTPRLPAYRWVAEWNEEALLAPKAGIQRSKLAQLRVKYIGLPPVFIPAEDEEAVTRVLEAFRCIPVFLPLATQKAFNEGYCNDTLWPVFHNVIDVYGEIPTRWWLKERQSGRWKAYMDANNKFASTVVENFHEGDLVWVQDFHLLLVPMMLARRHIAPVGLFLHSPFPSSEIYRSLSMRDELLRGMLNADHLGFHLFEYARHFLTSCRRILGLTHTSQKGGLLSVDYQGREVQVTVTHVGIEPEFLTSRFESFPDVTAASLAWKHLFRGRKIIAGIDSIERLKGVPLKLFAFEAFLAQHPEWVGRSVLIQYCVEDTWRPGDKQEASLKEIRALAERINSRFARDSLPAVFLVFRSGLVPVNERVALYAAADVFMNTSIRDGLNLHPFEYSYVRGGPECISSGLLAFRKRCKGRAGAQKPPAVSSRTMSGPHADPLFPAPLDAYQQELVAEISQWTPTPDGGVAVAVLQSLKEFADRTGIEVPFRRVADIFAEASRDPSGKGSAFSSPAGSAATSLLQQVQEDILDIAPGILILSEFSGASRVLRGAMRVNPWKVEELVYGLTHALQMSEEEQASRTSSNLQYICGNTTSSWAERVLVDLKTASKRSTARTYMGYGLGLGYRLMGFGSSFKPLNIESVLNAFKRASHRLIVCDYGGTLPTQDSSSSRRAAFELGLQGQDAAPPLMTDTKKALKLLSEDPRNTVFVISGKEKEVLQQAFASLPHVGLAAEHGFFYRWGAAPPVRTATNKQQLQLTAGAEAPASPALNAPAPILDRASSYASMGTVSSETGRAAVAAGSMGSTAASKGDNGMPWQTLGPTSRQKDWMALAAGIMETYATRTNGTYILRKGSAMSWHYGDADTEFGSMQAKELQDHLTGVLAGHYPVDVLSGFDYVEVRPRGVNKGVVLALIMDSLEGRPLSKKVAEVAGIHIGPSGHLVGAVPSPSSGSSVSSGVGASQDGGAKTALGGAALATVPSLSSTASAPLHIRAQSFMDSTLQAQTKTSHKHRHHLYPPPPPSRTSTDWKPRPLEFILCIGDDLADEEMFLTVQEFRKGRAALFARMSAQTAQAVLGNGGAGIATKMKPTSSTVPADAGASVARSMLAISSSATSSVASGTIGSVVASPFKDAATSGSDERAAALPPLQALHLPSGGLQPSSTRDADASAVLTQSAAPRVSKFGVGNNFLAGSASPALRSTASPLSGGPVGRSGTGTKVAGEKGTMSPTSQPVVYSDYSVTVGKKPSAAQYFLDDTLEVENLLRVLSQATAKSNRAKLNITVASGAAGVHHTALLPGVAPTPLTSTRIDLAQLGVTMGAGGMGERGIPGGRHVGGMGKLPVRMSLPAGMDALVARSSPLASSGSNASQDFSGPMSFVLPSGVPIMRSTSVGERQATANPPILFSGFPTGAMSMVNLNIGAGDMLQSSSHSASFVGGAVPLAMSPLGASSSSVPAVAPTGDISATIAAAAAGSTNFLASLAANATGELPFASGTSAGLAARVGNVRPGLPGAMAGLYASTAGLQSLPFQRGAMSEYDEDTGEDANNRSHDDEEGDAHEDDTNHDSGHGLNESFCSHDGGEASQQYGKDGKVAVSSPVTASAAAAAAAFSSASPNRATAPVPGQFAYFDRSPTNAAGAAPSTRAHAAIGGSMSMTAISSLAGHGPVAALSSNAVLGFAAYSPNTKQVPSAFGLQGRSGSLNALSGLAGPISLGTAEHGARGMIPPARHPVASAGPLTAVHHRPGGSLGQYFDHIAEGNEEDIPEF